MKLIKHNAVVVAEEIPQIFYRLRSKFRNRLLLKLIENDEAKTKLPYFIRNNFDNLPNKLQIKLLLKILEKKVSKDILVGVALILSEKFDRFSPYHRKKILLKLMKTVYENPQTAYNVRHGTK